MIVKREGGGWTLVRQVDHAAHCHGIARAWRGGMAGPDSVSASLEHAAAYHDLGWTEADGEPEIDTQGRPRNFTQADEARHTAFYTRAVRSIAGSHPGAAYLVSLHASGLYSRRYGWSGLKPVDWTAIGSHGRALLEAERAFRSELLARMSPADAEFEASWRSYMLLETFDYLSLLTCFGFESEGCAPVPTLPGQWAGLRVTRSGSWEIELDPFPFAGRELALEVPCIHLEQELFSSDRELRDAFGAAHEERRRTVYRAV